MSSAGARHIPSVGSQKEFERRLRWHGKGEQMRFEERSYQGGMRRARVQRGQATVWFEAEALRRPQAVKTPAGPRVLLCHRPLPPCLISRRPPSCLLPSSPRVPRSGQSRCGRPCSSLVGPLLILKGSFFDRPLLVALTPPLLLVPLLPLLVTRLPT